MAVKLVMHPRPRDIEAFEKIYDEEHVPMAIAKLPGKTKMVGTRILGSPKGTPRFHRIAEVHFPSKEALEACAASGGGRAGTPVESDNPGSTSISLRINETATSRGLPEPCNKYVSRISFLMLQHSSASQLDCGHQ
jgi:uncharacterized protein (TIGR02118 family)